MKHYIRYGNELNWLEIDGNLFDTEFIWKLSSKSKSWYISISNTIKLLGKTYDYAKQREELSNQCKYLHYKIEDDENTKIIYQGYLSLKGFYKPSGRYCELSVIDRDDLDCLFNDDKIDILDYDIEKSQAKVYYGSLEFIEYEEVESEVGGYISGTNVQGVHKWVLYSDLDKKERKFHINLNDYYDETTIKKKWVREVIYQATTPGDDWEEVETGKYAREIGVTLSIDIKKDYTNGDYYYYKEWAYLPDITYTNGVDLKEVILSLSTGCGKILYSEFLRNNSITRDNEIYSKYWKLILFHVTDITDPKAEFKATNLMVEKSKFIDEITELLNLELWVDNELYVEHKSWKQRDLKLNVEDNANRKQEFRYNEKTIDYEEWEMEIASNPEYNKIKEQYLKNCIKEINRTEISHKFQILTSDLLEVIKRDWDINEKGDHIVIIAVDQNGIITRDQGIINGRLALKNLVKNELAYVRANQLGYIDDYTILNKITAKGKTGDISLEMKLADFLQITPYNRIKTEYGLAQITELSWKGYICKIKYDII